MKSDGEQEVGIARAFLGAVDHQAGAMKSSTGIVSVALFGQVAAGDPVDRRVEMRAGMFAEGEIVPVPGGPRSS